MTTPQPVPGEQPPAYSPPPPGYTDGVQPKYPGGYQDGAPPTYQGVPAGYHPGVPAGYQPVPSQQQPYGYTGQVGVIVTQQPHPSVVVVGGCPACRVGVLENDFTCLGVCCAIFFFPLGILCCLAMRQRRCPNCGAIFG